MVGDKKTSYSPTIESIKISWKQSEFEKLVTTYGIAPKWEPEFPAAGSIVDKSQASKIGVYA